MFKILSTSIFMLLAGQAFSQNVGIGTNTPNSSAKLEISANDKGVLIPRISIANLNAAAPVTSPVVSLLVYNTNASTGLGYHYWNGTQWVKILDNNNIDHDWYELNTTTPPNDINDNIYTMGRVSIGTTTSGAALNVGGNQIISFRGTAPSSSITSPGSLIINANGGAALITPFFDEFRFNGFDVGPTSTVNIRSIDRNHTALTLGLQAGQTRNIMQIVDSGLDAVSVFDELGRLGIGTANPSINIEIVGDDRIIGQTIQHASTSQDGTQKAIQFNMRTDSIAWTQYVADPDGFSGVAPNSYEIWEYPQSSNPSCCRRRFVLESSLPNTTADLPGTVLIDQFGNLGVNNTNPDMRLSVYENKANNYIARFHSDGTTTDPYQGIRLGTAEGAGTLYADFAISRSKDLFGISVGTTSGDLALHTQNDAFMDFVIMRNSNVGIATTTPTDRLQVNGNARLGLVSPQNTGTLPSDGSRLYFSGGGAGATFDSDNSDPMFLYRRNVSSDHSELRVSLGDNTQAQDALVVGYLSGTFQERIRLQSDGNALKPGGGTWTATSDRRTKKSIQTFTDGLQVLTKINPVTFQYNGLYNTTDDGNTHVGIIAQEVQEVAPYMIGSYEASPSPESTKQEEILNYDGGTYMIYVLVNSVKEQQKTIEQQAAAIKALQKEVQALKK
jgi:hypothetical protein